MSRLHARLFGAWPVEQSSRTPGWPGALACVAPLFSAICARLATSVCCAGLHRCLPSRRPALARPAGSLVQRLAGQEAAPALGHNFVPMRVVLVAAVALFNSERQVLLASRPAGKDMAGLWEFPGGKVGTTGAAGLSRQASCTCCGAWQSR